MNTALVSKKRDREGVWKFIGVGKNSIYHSLARKDLNYNIIIDV